MSAAPSQALPQDQSEGMSQLVDVDAASDPQRSSRRRIPPRAAVGFAPNLKPAIFSFFRVPHLKFLQDDREFLLGRTQTSSALHKNVAYRPAEDRITGLAKSEEVEAARLRLILKNYSQHAAQFLGELLPPYAGKVETRFRQLPSSGRTRTPCSSPRAKRFASLRFVSHAAYERRPHPAFFHQSQP